MKKFLKKGRPDLEMSVVQLMNTFLSSIDTSDLHGLAIHFNETVRDGQAFVVTNNDYPIDCATVDQFLFPDEWDGWPDSVLDGAEEAFMYYENQFKELCGGLEGYEDEYYKLEELHEKRYLDTFLRAMITIRKTANLSDETLLTLWFSDSDNAILKKSVKKLNSTKVYKLFAAHWK